MRDPIGMWAHGTGVSMEAAAVIAIFAAATGAQIVSPVIAAAAPPLPEPFQCPAGPPPRTYGPGTRARRRWKRRRAAGRAS